MNTPKTPADRPDNAPDLPPGKQGQVTVSCDGVAFTLDRRPYSTAELLAAFGVASGYLLNIKRTNGLDPLNDKQHTPLKDGMEFFSQAPGGASS